MSDFDIIRATLDSIRADVAEVRTGQVSAAAVAQAAKEAAHAAAIGVLDIGKTTVEIRERVARMEENIKPLIPLPERVKAVETTVAAAEASKRDWPTRITAGVALIGLAIHWVSTVVRGH